MAGDQHVGRRHVPVHDVQALAFAIGQLVRVGQAFTDPHANQARLFDGEGHVVLAAVLDDSLEIGAIHVLHDDEVGVVANADVEDLNAVRVGEVSADARLVQEHADELLLLGQVGKNALDGDDLLEALEAGALGAVDLRHSTSSDLLENFVALLGCCHRQATAVVGTKAPYEGRA